MSAIFDRVRDYMSIENKEPLDLDIVVPMMSDLLDGLELAESELEKMRSEVERLTGLLDDRGYCEHCSNILPSRPFEATQEYCDHEPVVLSFCKQTCVDNWSAR